MRSLELLEIFSSSNYPVIYAYAKSTHTCIRCKQAVKAFTDASARLEYMVSALCEECQAELLHQRVVVQ
ncbi:MAG: hypothetical protein JW821_03355 [Deltaproteobacteria bacterium]|nr:hypothetical protein [Deltaproteobacteria bacterium]